MNAPFTREHARVHAAAMIAAFLRSSIDTAGRVTDFNEGSNEAAIFEALGLRFEHLDNKVFGALRRAIPTILYEFFGEGDGVTTTVGFPLLPALPGTSIGRFTRQSGFVGALQIPVGFRLAVPGIGGVAEKAYSVTTPLLIPVGQDIGETTIRATTTGKAGNTSANTLQLKDTLQGLGSGTNPAAIGNGSEIETEEGRRQRFVKYIRNLARAQEEGLEVGASLAQVLDAGVVIERALYTRAMNVPGKRGLVDLYVDNGGATASPALLARAQEIVDGGFDLLGTRIPGYKAAGIVVRCKAVNPKVQAVDVAFRPAPGYTFSALEGAVKTAVENYLFGLGVFQPLVLSALICAVKDVRGVDDVVILSPTANVPVTFGDRVMPGVVTVTAL
jgi:uncharacterized phage protein gp47/JayE